MTPSHVGDGHTIAHLECASVNSQVLLLIITWSMWQGTLAVGHVKGRLLVRYSGLGENVQLWTLLNTKTVLLGARDSWLASQHVQHVGSVHQPYSLGHSRASYGQEFLCFRPHSALWSRHFSIWKAPFLEGWGTISIRFLAVDNQ